jgi:tripartite-type tricarboxylate transporter receptor subunit TctC
MALPSKHIGNHVALHLRSLSALPREDLPCRAAISRANAMKLPRRKFLHLTAATVALPAVSRLARAQTYPSRPVRVIVPAAPGGQVDAIGRLLAQSLSARTRQQFYVENVPGGAMNNGNSRAAHSEPDGYTILVTDGINLTANPSLFSKMTYSVDDFSPVTVAAVTRQLLVVHPSLQAANVQELVSLIKARPGYYSYASAGFGGGSHLIAELFRISLGLDIQHVPFNGGAPAIMAVVANQIPISFSSPAATIPQVRQGNLRALAVLGDSRVHDLPDVPTMREVGFPGINCDAWLPVLVPAGTPGDVIALLRREIEQAAASTDFQQRLTVLGFDPASKTPEEITSLFQSERKRWEGVINTAGIKVN